MKHFKPFLCAHTEIIYIFARFQFETTRNK